MRSSGNPRNPYETRRHVAYQSFSQFLNESNSRTNKRQKLALALEKKDIPLGLCPTQGLLICQGNTLKKYLKKLIKKTPQLVPCLDEMLTQEIEIYARGNYALYHGCNINRYATMYLHTKLHELFHGTQNKNFLQLRQPTPIFSPEGDPIKIRCNYLQNGGGWLNHESQYHLLFANNTLGSNLYGRPFCDESALSFFIGNNPVFETWKKFMTGLWKMFLGKSNEIDVSQLFNNYQLNAWYTAHKNEINNALTFEHKHNVMFQLELSPYLLSNSSFACKPLGSPLFVKINNKNTRNQQKICAAQCNKPFTVNKPHLMIWALILTDDLLLDAHAPETQKGFAVHVHSMDPTGLARIHKQIDDLVAHIARDLKANPNHQLHNAPNWQHEYQITN